VRRIIAGFPCDLTRSDVLEAMRGITPELVTGESVITGRRPYPVKQVGEVRTRQDCRDVSTAQMTWAITALGFTSGFLARPQSATVPGAGLSGHAGALSSVSRPRDELSPEPSPIARLARPSRQ
jgi:hypothetical protein